MDKIKYVLNGTVKYYSEEELRQYYCGLLKNSGIYAESVFNETFEHFLNTLKENDGDPYADLPESIRQLCHYCEALTGSLLVSYSRGEIIKDITSALASDHKITAVYYSKDKEVSSCKDIHTNKDVAKMLSSLKIKVIEGKDIKIPSQPVANNIIYMPSRERYASSFGWNHDLIHEMTHRIDTIHEFSKKTLMACIINKLDKNKPISEILDDLCSGKINTLPDESKEYAGYYSFSEIAVEHVAYKMMGRMGIKQEPDARMKYEKYVSGYHSLLKPLGFSTLDDPKTLDSYVKHTDKLLKTVEKQYELSTGKTVIKPRRQAKDKEIDK